MTPNATIHNGTGISLVSTSFGLLLLLDDDDGGMFVMDCESINPSVIGENVTQRISRSKVVVMAGCYR